jgi:hypothetical protein
MALMRFCEIIQEPVGQKISVSAEGGARPSPGAAIFKQPHAFIYSLPACSSLLLRPGKDALHKLQIKAWSGPVEIDSHRRHL